MDIDYLIIVTPRPRASYFNNVVKEVFTGLARAAHKHFNAEETYTRCSPYLSIPIDIDRKRFYVIWLNMKHSIAGQNANSYQIVIGFCIRSMPPLSDARRIKS